VYFVVLICGSVRCSVRKSIRLRSRAMHVSCYLCSGWHYLAICDKRFHCALSCCRDTINFWNRVLGYDVLGVRNLGLQQFWNRR
jgi:hypothetical protein